MIQTKDPRFNITMSGGAKDRRDETFAMLKADMEGRGWLLVSMVKPKVGSIHAVWFKDTAMPPHQLASEPGYEYAETIPVEGAKNMDALYNDMKAAGWSFVALRVSYPDNRHVWRRRLPERTHPHDGRAATPKELRKYAADIIGSEISDRVAACRQYGAPAVALLAAACKLLSAGRHQEPEVVSDREGE